MKEIYFEKRQHIADTENDRALLDKWVTPICEKIGDMNIVYLFDRAGLSYDDCNPILQALSGVYGWEYKTPKSDLNNVAERMIQQAKPLQKQFDVVIDVMGTRNEDTMMYNCIIEKFQCKDRLTINHDRLYIGYVEDMFLHHSLFNLKDFSKEKQDKMWSKFWDCFYAMGEKNKGIFALKYFDSHPLKEYLYDFFDLSLWDSSLNELSTKIDGKNIIIFDKCQENGKKLSYEAETAIATFNPKSVTIVSFLTPLNQQETATD